MTVVVWPCILEKIRAWIRAATRARRGRGSQEKRAVRGIPAVERQRLTIPLPARRRRKRLTQKLDVGQTLRQEPVARKAIIEGVER